MLVNFQDGTYKKILKNIYDYAHIILIHSVQFRILITQNTTMKLFQKYD